MFARRRLDRAMAQLTSSAAKTGTLSDRLPADRRAERMAVIRTANVPRRYLDTSVAVLAGSVGDVCATKNLDTEALLAELPPGFSPEIESAYSHGVELALLSKVHGHQELALQLATLPEPQIHLLIVVLVEIVAALQATSTPRGTTSSDRARS